MKKILSTLFAISSFFVVAQTQLGINYQSVIRNTGGTILASTPVTVEFKLYSTATFTNVVLYHETHSTTTNQFGMVNVVIGQGTVIGGVVTFSNVPWIGGVAYEIYVNSNLVGSRQPFLSVPYALASAYAPAPSVTFSNNILSVGGNTVSITSGTTYTAGTGIGLTGNIITNTLPDQTVTINGAGVSGSYPNYTISPTPSVSVVGPNVSGTFPNYTINAAPAQSLAITGNTLDISGGNSVVLPAGVSYTAGNGIDLTGNIVVNTVPDQTVTLNGTGSTSVTGTYPNFTINTPAAVTPTITSSGIAVVTPSTGNVFNVDVAAPVLSYNQGTKELTITQGSAVTTETLIGTGSNTVSIVGAGLATVTPTTGSTFTVAVPNPTLSVGGGSISISGGNAVAIPSSSTTLVQGTNVTLNQSGNTYTVSSPSQSLAVNSNSLSITGGNTVIIPTSSVVSGNPNIIVNQSGNTYSVSAVPQTLSIASNSIVSLTNGGSVNITPAVLSYTSGTNVIKLTDGLSSNTFTLSSPALALSGSTLTSGASTNSVNLATLPGLWSASSTTAVVLTNTSNNVGIGTVPASQFKLDVAATAGNSVTIHGINNGSTDAFAAVFGENTSNGIGVYAQSNGGKGVFGKSTSGAGVYGESSTGDGGKFLLTGTLTANSAVNAQTNGTGPAIYAKTFNTTAAALAAKFDGHTHIAGKAKIDSSLTMAAYNTPPIVSSTNEGRIYYDRPTNKFKVSENGQPYVNLIGGGTAPWMQSAGSVTLTNINDRVGIGTSNPNAALEIAVTNTVTDGLQVNITNINNGSNAVQVINNGIGNAGYFEVANTLNSNNALTALSNAPSSSLRVVNTNTASAGSHGIVSNAVSGSAVSATNSSTLSATIRANNTAGDVFFADAVNGVAYYGRNNSTTGLSTMELASNGNGSAIFAYKNAGATGNVASFSNNATANISDAVAILNTGTGAGLSSSNTNASPTSYAGVFDGGITTKGKTTTAAGYAFRVFNSASTSLLSVRNDAVVEIGANVGINILNPTNRLHVNSSYTNAAVFAENITAVSTASVAHGVFAKASSTHSLAAAVFGNNVGTGPSLFGFKSATETGIAGRFELLNTSNSADALFAITNGAGAAIHAVNGPTVTGGSNLGLMVENGHIGSMTSSALTASTNATCGCMGSITMDGHSTDVAGTLRAVYTSTTGASVDITVTFAKPYKKYPVVMITPTESPNAGNSFPNYIVVPVGVAGNYTGFRLTIVGGGVNNPGTYGYNYMVIEGK